MCMLRDWRLRPRRIFRRFSGSERFAAVLIWFATLVVMAAPSTAIAEPLEYIPFATVYAEGIYSRLGGRIGFAQENGGAGTLNDLIHDLGLPLSNLSVELGARVRPLEHHVLRVYGRIPETYRGGRTLSRTLTTRNVTYPAGTPIVSELKTGMFGLGYDLDFLVGPRWFGGLNGDLRHVEMRVRMGGNAFSAADPTVAIASLYEDTLSVNEMVPCLGAHLLYRAPAQLNPGLVGPLTLGGFSRITFGMTPNWLNYFNISAGFSLGLFRSGSVSVETKIGYNYEAYFHNQESLAGRALEIQREGVLLSLEGLF